MRDEIRFALDSLLVNRRRMVLTVAIIAVGVASLVGIQTAVAVLAGRVAGSFGKLGASLFTIQAKDDAPPITLKQVNAAFRSDIPLPSQKNARSTEYHPLHSAFSIWSLRNKRAQVRCGAAATDPVVRVIACDAQYLAVQGVSVSVGRNFSEREVEERQAVALIGENVRKKLFGSQDGVGEQITCGSGRYRVVGVIDRQGSMFGVSLDGALLVPSDGAPVSWCVTVRSSGGGSLSADTYEAFLKKCFDLWYADFQNGRYISIRHIDNYIGILLGHPPENCAMYGVCGSYFVVEANGDLYPCDFYCKEAYRLGSVFDDAPFEANETQRRFVEASRVIHAHCKTCRYYALCRGGCRRDRTDGFTKNQYCAAYYNFFDYAADRMVQAAKVILAQENRA